MSNINKSHLHRAISFQIMSFIEMSNIIQLVFTIKLFYD